MRNPPYGAVPYPPPSPPMRPTEITEPELISTPECDEADDPDDKQGCNVGVAAMPSAPTAARRKRAGAA